MAPSHRHPRRRLLALAASAWPVAWLWPSLHAAAQAWPPRELRLVVPAEAGGGMDLLARTLAAQLQSHLQARAPAGAGTSIVVLNRSGAGGNIGTVSVARAPADGTTLLFTGLGHVANPLVHADAGYDAMQDFTPLAMLAGAPNVLVVNAAFKDWPLARLLRDPLPDGHQLAYASAGTGTSSHLAAEWLMARTAARWLHVPYRGTAPALRALLSGEVQLMMLPVSSLAGALAGGRAHAVAVAHGSRLRAHPGLRTLAELGVRGAEFAQWYALFAPAATPRAIVDELALRIQEVQSSAALLAHMSEHGMEPMPAGRDAAVALLRSEHERLSQLVRRDKPQAP